MAEHKPTTDRKQVWTFLGLLALASAIFGYAVLPHLDPVRSKLVGNLAPDFTLRLISEGEDGNRLALSDMRGQVVLLDFWASWCAPCRVQAPIIERFARAHEGDAVSVVGVNTGDAEPAARDFIRASGISYPVVFDEQGLVSRAFGANELPTLVVVNARGEITAVHSRVLREAELEELVREAKN